MGANDENDDDGADGPPPTPPIHPTRINAMRELCGNYEGSMRELQGNK